MREDSEDRELAIVVISGRIAVDGRRAAHRGGQRAARSAFDGMPEAVYLPPGTAYTVEALEGVADVAFCESLADPAKCGPIAHVRVEDVAIEIRGSGNATRQINHILPPGVRGAPPADRRGLHAGRLLVELPAAQARRARRAAPR